MDPVNTSEQDSSLPASGRKYSVSTPVETIVILYSPQETSLQTGLRLTSKCRRQIKASTLCVKTTLGHSTSHGMAPAATTKSQTITSYDCSARSSRRLATTSGRQYLDTVCGQGEKTLLTKLVSSPRPRLVATCMGK